MTRDASSSIELQDVESQKPKHEQLSHAGSLDDQDAAPYSVFSKNERWIIAVIIGFTMLFSPLSANIYFPAINQLQEALHTSAQNINLTITTYLIFQAAAPALFGDVADTTGRRPVFIVMFAIYIIANLALALQTSFAAMLVLRMLQSLGCSATVAISYGVVADVSTPAERGSMLGFAMIATNLGPALAPVIGGVLVDKAGWRWIFWFLLICGAFVLMLIVLFLPETARHIVGNGRILPRKWRRPSASLITSISIPRKAKACIPGSDSQEKRPLRVPNPLRSLRILVYRDAGAITLMSGIFYLIYYCIQASIARIFKKLYGLNDTLVGVSYLAIGVGVVLGGIFNGKLMDWNYKEMAREIGHTIDKVKGDDLTKFPIERARLRSMMYLIIANSGVLAGYGWSLQGGAHLATPLTLQFALGFLTTCTVQTFNTLLVDVFPSNPSAAAASGNIVRCGLSAAGIAAMDPLMDEMGYGWYFTFLALLGCFFGLLGAQVICKKGMGWRHARIEQCSI